MAEHKLIINYHLHVMVAQRLPLINRRGAKAGHVRLDRAEALKVLEFMEGGGGDAIFGGDKAEV